MPRYNVQLSNGLWCVWSTVADDWITEPMTFRELKEFRKREAIGKADEETASLLTNKPKINKLSFKEWKEEFGTIESIG